MNKFPWWKSLLIILSLFLGSFIALPNLYGEDPAVQIIALNGSKVSLKDVDQVNKILDKAHIKPKSVKLENDILLVRLSGNEEQLKAKDLLQDKLGSAFSVALNLATNTPDWMLNLGLRPMSLGLDLRGGVRFLMEVDMSTVIKKQQDQWQDLLRNSFRREKINYQGVSKEGDALVFKFADENFLSQAKSFITFNYAKQLVPEQVDRLLLSVKMSESELDRIRDFAIEQNLTILRKRVEELGVSEPTLQRQGSDRIVVELPGVQDTARAKEILGATATLDFRLVNTNVNVQSAVKGIIPADSDLYYEADGSPVVLYRKTAVGGEHIIDARADLSQHGLPQVNITLDSQGGDLMYEVTKTNLQKPMATLYSEFKDSGQKDASGKIILQKKEEVINIATIQGRFSNNFQITGIGSYSQAQHLALLLRSGALIAPVFIVEERTIGASLGADNIKQGFDAGLVSLAITILFCLIVYRMFGLFAVVALLLNLAISIGLMSLIGATLTMPGIAGIILSVGMSIDANVLIYERIKEEIRAGKSPAMAIQEGYSGAFTSIWDANLTTILTALVLYSIGSGPIRGFAVTLSIGVVVSMFTAIVVTRMLASWVYGGKKSNKKLWI